MEQQRLLEQIMDAFERDTNRLQQKLKKFRDALEKMPPLIDPKILKAVRGSKRHEQD